MKSDIEIARSAKLEDIYCIAKKTGIKEDEIIPWGDYKAKISLNILNRINRSLEDYHKLFYKFDHSLVEKLSSERYCIIENIRDSSKKMSKDELILIVSMEQIIEKIASSKEVRMALEY